MKLPLSIRQLTVGAMITESLNTQPILLPILFSVASAHSFTLPAFSLPSIIGISGMEMKAIAGTLPHIKSEPQIALRSTAWSQSGAEARCIS